MISLSSKIKYWFDTHALKNLFVYTASSFLNKLLSFFLLPFFTKKLSPADYGNFVLYSNYVAFLTPFVSLSILNSVGADFFKLNKEEFKVSLSSVLLAPLLLVFLYTIATPVYFYFNEKPNGVNLFFLMFIPFLALSNFLYELLLTLLRNLNFVYQYAHVTAVRTFIELFFSIWLIQFFNFNWEGRLWAWLIVGVVVSIYSYFFLKKQRFLTTKINSKHIFSELRYVGPVLLSQLSVLIVINSDRFFLSKFETNFEVGVYGVASQVSLVLFAFSSAIISTFYPFLFETLNSKTENYKKAIFKKMIFYSILVFIAALIIVIISPSIYYFMIDKNYLYGVTYVKWQILAYLFWFFYWMMLGVLYFFKAKRAMIISSIFNIVLSLSLNYLLGYRLGVTGILCALIFSCIGSVFFLFYLIRFKFKLL